MDDGLSYVRTLRSKRVTKMAAFLIDRHAHRYLPAISPSLSRTTRLKDWVIRINSPTLQSLPSTSTISGVAHSCLVGAAQSE
jgi:hypothetical protein